MHDHPTGDVDRLAGEVVGVGGGEKECDARDVARDAAPLAAATDAETLDTTDLGVEGAVAAALAIVDRRMKSALTRR